jgi:hypothetical protein
MPPDHTYIDIPLTIANGEGFSGVSDLVRNILGNYVDEYASYGPYQGTDEYGRAYDAGFVPAAESSQSALVSFSDTVDVVGRNVVTTAKLLDSSNGVNTEIASAPLV